MKQGVAITGRNRNHTGPPCNVGRPRARPGAADCPRARRPAGSVTERQRAKQYWPIGRASNNHLSVPLSFGGSCTGCQRVDFKLGSITFRAIDNGVPSYLASDILYSQPFRTLHSGNTIVLHRPHASSDFHRHSFAFSRLQWSGTTYLLPSYVSSGVDWCYVHQVRAVDTSRCRCWHCSPA